MKRIFSLGTLIYKLIHYLKHTPAPHEDFNLIFTNDEIVRAYYDIAKCKLIPKPITDSFLLFKGIDEHVAEVEERVWSDNHKKWMYFSSSTKRFYTSDEVERIE